MILPARAAKNHSLSDLTTLTSGGQKSDIKVVVVFFSEASLLAS